MTWLPKQSKLKNHQGCSWILNELCSSLKTISYRPSFKSSLTLHRVVSHSIPSNKNSDWLIRIINENFYPLSNNQFGFRNNYPWLEESIWYSRWHNFFKWNQHKKKQQRVQSGMQQVSILGPFSFIFYLNDLSVIEQSNNKLDLMQMTQYSKRPKNSAIQRYNQRVFVKANAGLTDNGEKKNNFE